MKLSTNFLLFLIQKPFIKKTTFSPLSASPLSNTPISSSFTVQFLVNSCGLPLKSALSASQKLRLQQNNVSRTQAVLLFLKSHHFDDTQIADLIKKRPTILRCRVEDNLRPKFEFLVRNGFSGNLLPELILANPCIPERSLDSCIKPLFEFLRSHLVCNEKIVPAIKHCSWLLSRDFKVALKPNIEFLIKEGVPPCRVTKLIVTYPRTLTHKHDSVVCGVNKVKNLGHRPDNAMFIHALAVRMQMSDTTWKKKIEVMRSLGWSEEEILGTFKRYPQVLHYSEKKIRGNVDFLISTCHLQREILLVYPYLLFLSVDKRIRPRLNVINLLKSKDLIKGDNKKIPTLLTISEKKFLENYVVKYEDDVPGLLEVYMGTKKHDT